jgi:ArsR family transcriptional regulator
MDVKHSGKRGGGRGESEPVFRALADSTRQRILQLLIREELSVSELVDVLRLPQSTISRHLRVLRTAGLITDRREGATTLCRARRSTQDEKELAGLLMDWFGQWPLPTPLVDRLARVLQGRAPGGATFFERLGRRWDELREAAFGAAFAVEAFVSLLPREWTVADIGAGTGYLLPILADNFKAVIAVEPAAAMLACARQRVAEDRAAQVTFHQGEASALPMADRACDLAIACLVLHHVAEPRQALDELRRIVRPGGRVLIVEQRAHENQKFYEMMQDRWWGFEPADLAGQLAGAGFGAVRWHPLRWAGGRSAQVEAPGLFVLTGERAS